VKPSKEEIEEVQTHLTDNIYVTCADCLTKVRKKIYWHSILFTPSLPKLCVHIDLTYRELIAAASKSIRDGGADVFMLFLIFKIITMFISVKKWRFNIH